MITGEGFKILIQRKFLASCEGCKQNLYSTQLLELWPTINVSLIQRHCMEYEKRLLSMGWSKRDKMWGEVIERDPSCRGEVIESNSTLFLHLVSH
ncbi:hypothetical protein HAX54_038395, partial [Datura stramonium]|nr:hypothetical protein [Datura stramonium]